MLMRRRRKRKKRRRNREGIRESGRDICTVKSVDKAGALQVRLPVGVAVDLLDCIFSFGCSILINGLGIASLTVSWTSALNIASRLDLEEMASVASPRLSPSEASAENPSAIKQTNPMGGEGRG